jgi:hypothetical protein
MGVRRKKRRRFLFHKPDLAVSILASITVLLLIAWAGLHWKDSKDRELVASADQSQQTVIDGLPQVEDEDLLPIRIETNSSTDVEEESAQDLTVVESEDGQGEAITDPSSNQTLQETGAANVGGGTSSGQGSIHVDKTDHSSTSATKPNQPGIKLEVRPDSKPDANSASNSDAKPIIVKGESNTTNATTGSGGATFNDQSPIKVNPTGSTSPTTSNSGSATNSGTTNSSTSNSSETTGVTQVEKYEQQFITIQGKCNKDMKAVLSDAESSMGQLDRQDPSKLIMWRDNLNGELGAAQSKCDSAYQDLLQTAENDKVSMNVIESWNQTYSELKGKLHEESEAKLKQLMGG